VAKLLDVEPVSLSRYQRNVEEKDRAVVLPGKPQRLLVSVPLVSE
jgi:hypothetical protein